MSFPWVKQHDGMQCGAACLTMVCRAHGLHISLGEVDSLCGCTTEGVSLKGIADSARKLGLASKSGWMDAASLAHAPKPCILHWNQNHFVVVYKANKRGTRFRIADPKSGKRTISAAELKEAWIPDAQKGKGIAMLLTPDANFNAIKQSHKKKGLSAGFLWGYIMRYRKYFAHVLAGLMLGCIFQLILPFLTQWIVDKGIAHKDLHLIWMILLGELMIVAGKTITDFLRRWILLHISMRINLSLVSDFFIKLMRLPMSFFDTKLLGDLLQRIGDHRRIQTFLTTECLNVIFTLMNLVVFGIVLLIYNSLVFLVFTACSALYAAWILMFMNKRKTLDYEMFDAQAKNQNKTYQLISSMQEIKLQRCEQRRRWEWEDTQAELFSVQMKSLKLQQTQEGGAVFINEAKNILITVLTATAVINGQMTLGAMLAVQYIIGQLNSPIEQLMAFAYSLQDVRISLERINEVHDREDECNPLSRHFPSDSKNNDILIDNACFKYDKHSPYFIIKNVSMRIPENKVTAIVGASGSGKSTLMKLILGYYQLNSGAITAAGQPLAETNLDEWRERCGAVMQDGCIFSESIARNIAVGDGDIDNERLTHAAQMANIYEYVTSLPLGFSTIIGSEGIGLSQGQKQRILIARAIYKNPDFIFLDEATNALDTKNERDIVGNLESFFNGRTVVIVAHRLSTVKNADQIIVLDEGKIVETGNHKTLTAMKGRYYNLVKNQLELGC